MLLDNPVMETTGKVFDSLGYHVSTERLSVAEKTIENIVTRAIRLYEQKHEEPSGSSVLGLYV